MLQTACCAAWNDWAVEEFNAVAPDRLCVLAFLPGCAPDAAAAELERAAKRGHRGAVIDVFDLDLADPAWDRLWAAAQDTGLPISFHLKDGTWSRHLSYRVGKWQSAAFASVLPLQLDEPLAIMTFSGALERHPGLKLVPAEAGIGWLPYFVARMDLEWRNLRDKLDYATSLPPSELFRRQVLVTFEEEALGRSSCRWSVSSRACGRRTTRTPTAPSRTRCTRSRRRSARCRPRTAARSRRPTARGCTGSTDVERTREAAVLDEPNEPLAIGDVVVDAPGPREVLVRTVASGVCASDLHLIRRRRGPIVPGHEPAGIVEQIGADVTHVKPGDRVIACLSIFCGVCDFCISGRSHLCGGRMFERRPGEPPRLSRHGAPVGQMSQLSSFAEQMLVPENALVKVRDEMPLDRAAPDRLRRHHRARRSPLPCTRRSRRHLRGGRLRRRRAERRAGLSHRRRDADHRGRHAAVEARPRVPGRRHRRRERVGVRRRRGGPRAHAGRRRVRLRGPSARTRPRARRTT